MDLVKKKYVCRSCSYKGAVLCAIKDNRAITSDFLKEHYEYLGEIQPSKIYTYEVLRGEYDIVLGKKPIECVCEQCGEKEIQYIPNDNEVNVLNFYESAQPEKWLRGFEGLGKR